MFDVRRVGVWSCVLVLACGGDGDGVAAEGGGTESGPETSSTGSETAAASEATSATTAMATSMSSASTTTGVDATGMASSGGSETGEGSSEDTGEARLGPAAACFAGVYVNDPDLGPDYDQFDPVVGSHCLGTDHQDIAGVERVVFLGDSITVGTPPSLSGQFYRSRLANQLRDQFGLSYGWSESLWKAYDPFEGTSAIRQAEDFWSCARWGGRNDDLMQDDTQLEDCFPPGTRNDRTLVVITSGGNDIANLTKRAIDGATQQELWEQAIEMIDLKQEAVEWLKDPAIFPNGNFVVFANIYEFTDGTGEVESCDVSALAGFDEPVPAPEELADVVVWIEEEYMRIAVETGSDMIFLFEEFCGHGFNHDNPEAPCYRGPGSARWFDLTCTHPNPTGHQEIADMFMAIVNE